MSVAVASPSSKSLPSPQRVEAILGQLDRLPTLPSIVVRLLSVTSSSDSSARDVVEIIESDPALTTLILRLVQRSDLGVRGDIISVAQSVTLLGFNAVRNAVLSAKLLVMFQKTRDPGLDTPTRDGLWQHALAVACVSEMIAARVDGPQLAVQAFVCGLLHDLGKLALESCLPKSYARAVDRVERKRTCICDAEHEVFGLDHTIAGKRLATRWRLPRSVVECVWLHHQNPDELPSSVAHRELLRVVHLADHLVRRDGIGFSGYRNQPNVDELAGSMGLEPAATADMLAQVPQRIEPFQELLGFQVGADQAQHVATLVAANDTLGQLNTELSEENRSLRSTAAWFRVLRRFNDKLGDHDSVGAVCVSASDAIRDLLGVNCAVTFFTAGDQDDVHLGSAGSSDDAPPISIVSALKWQELIGVLEWTPDKSAKTLLPATGVYDEVWRRATRSNPPDMLWLLRLAHGDHGCGGVLVAAGVEAVRPYRSASLESETLSNSIALALSLSASRTSSDRMSEELLVLNRRLQATQQQLVRTQSISMIAEMAAGAAHELNNPLAVISGRAQLQLLSCEEPETAKVYEVIIDQTKKAARIVTDLMRFSKPEAPQPLLRPLGEALESLCQRWCDGSSVKADQITLSIVDPQATVYADASQLGEILDAVMDNAAEAMKQKTPNLRINSLSNASDETVRIVVADDGVGMAREVLEHAVDPFYSSRPAGRGRGLGLSKAHRLAEINGGSLSLESTPGVGTTVIIELPSKPPTS